MKVQRKLMILSLSGILGLGIAVGGATFALFSSNATNANNQFTAGTLKITSNRDDVPTSGPMFYTNVTADMPGIDPTGIWAPGDKQTRGLFLKNEGTLRAKLKTVSVTNEEGSNIGENAKFTNKAKVVIWQVKWFNSVGLNGKQTNLTATQMDKIMNFLNDGYKEWATENPGADPTQDSNWKSQLLQAENLILMQHINDIMGTPGATVSDDLVKVTDLYGANLADLLSTADVSSLNIIAEPGKTELLAFTVELPLNSDNTYQGISANLTFKTYWEQVRNN
ncbi:TasA family protein [Neobacillus cucumis]|uniref:TasA family protein n=1 Tax=Neobacillus cucumis TaxID=1740721 RepID=UPI0028530B06|nr:TasA family protein [Neobacillus cucumis]MDR4948299.1 TasA family protein [Neobacillus cucumis]